MTNDDPHSIHRDVSVSGRRPIVIVAHGSPWVPCAQQAFVERIAAAVSPLLPDHNVSAATLAGPGSVDEIANTLENPILFPLFMTDGWFVSTNMPNRFRKAGLDTFDVVTPLGLLPDLAEVTALRVEKEARDAGFSTQETTVVLLAHGSPSNPNPARATRAFAEKLKQYGHYKDLRIGFVDEEPSLAQAADVRGPSILVPFFAARAGHVLIDMPEALAEAAYEGIVLPPIGTWPEIPALIAQAVEVSPAVQPVV